MCNFIQFSRGYTPDSLSKGRGDGGDGRNRREERSGRVRNGIREGGIKRGGEG